MSGLPFPDGTGWSTRSPRFAGLLPENGAVGCGSALGRGCGAGVMVGCCGRGCGEAAAVNGGGVGMVCWSGCAERGAGAAVGAGRGAADPKWATWAMLCGASSPSRKSLALSGRSPASRSTGLSGGGPRMACASSPEAGALNAPSRARWTSGFWTALTSPTCHSFKALLTPSARM